MILNLKLAAEASSARVGTAIASALRCYVVARAKSGEDVTSFCGYEEEFLRAGSKST